MLSFVARVAIATGAAMVIIRVGIAILRGLAQPPPAPPPPGELRKVKATYRCEMCGTEVRLTLAPNEDPQPPRHCMEDMQLVTPLE